MLKEDLKHYLLQNGRDKSLLKLYQKFPYKGQSLKRKQKMDAVRSVERQIRRERKQKEPKILLFDIETAPLRAYVWRLWKQNVHPTTGQLQSNWFMLTYSAKWLFDDRMISERLTSKETFPFRHSNDERKVYFK